MKNRFQFSSYGVLIVVIIFLLSVDIYAYSPSSEYEGKIKADAGRQVYRLNHGWNYIEHNCTDIAELSPEVSTSAEIVDLPHTWNAFDATDNEPGYRRDAGWYRKKIYIPDSQKPIIFMLRFEGVNICSEVFVNQEKAGSHTGGYVGFSVDMTPLIKRGAMNQIDVRVDNSINPDVIPSQKSDFFIFGGIVRDVWLQILPATYIDRVLINTPVVSRDKAETTLILRINNRTDSRQNCLIDAKIYDGENRVVSQKESRTKCETGNCTITIDMPDVLTPDLWEPDSPHLHTLKIELSTEESQDRLAERYGYRWFEFEENGPFFLNGKRLLLRGTHRHEEFAGYGNAMPDSLHRLDMQMIKDMGANFVRLAHYPQDPEVYRACDELGLLVWDELPWCRGGMGKDKWKTNTKNLLTEQIIQNYNHPSIIIWSLGNELYWLPDFPDGGNPDSLNAFITELNELAHSLDPGRLTAMRKYYDGAGITDLFSPSIWSGWYSGVYKNYEKALSSSRKKYKRFLHAEYGGASHVGRHTENPITGEGMVNENEWDERPNMINVKRISKSGDWSENYIVDLFDWHLMVSEKLDWFTGSAQWAFKDFGTPLRPENAIPYINQKGLVDRAGTPKDAYYVFKSYWTENPRFCYIESPTWVERTGRPGEKRQVCVYSNCERVRLTLNGDELEIKDRDTDLFPACGLNWDVIFEEGENVLFAVGYADGEEVAKHAVTLTYRTEQSGKPEELVLTADKMRSGNVLIRARVIDDKGYTCLDFNKRVYFDLSGPGFLKSAYGTPTGSRVIEFASGRAAIEYIPASGRVVIEARTQDFKGSYIELIDGREIE